MFQNSDIEKHDFRVTGWLTETDMTVPQVPFDTVISDY